MGLNGENIVVETHRRESRDEIVGKDEKDIVSIEVGNYSTFYVFEGRHIGVADIAAIILQPIRDALG